MAVDLIITVHHKKESDNAFSQLEVNQLTNQPTNQIDETVQLDVKDRKKVTMLFSN
jgi:hypothetical protein